MPDELELSLDDAEAALRARKDRKYETTLGALRHSVIAAKALLASAVFDLEDGNVK